MIGKVLSHYKILEKLGEGGMGVVYKAEDLKLKRFVALKFLHQHMQDEEATQRFIHEAQTVSALEHPNICAIYEINETPDGQMYIVMPCYEGESLQKRIERGPLSIEEALDIGSQIASGLARAHEKGIVHRDIKPGNVLLTKDGAKIVDFGLAKLTTQTKLTRTGTTLGTVVYMSPEQARGTEVDHRSDIWSLGIILYEMVTGKPPFRGEYDQALVYSILNEEPELVTSIRKDVPAELEDIIAKALAKKPEERYQSAAELFSALTELKQALSVGPGGVVGRKLSKAAQRRVLRKWLRIGIPAAALLVVAAFFVLKPLLVKEIPLSERKKIAVFTFENQTGDSAYAYLGDAIPSLLISSLEQQSRRLRVTTLDRLRDLTEQVGQAQAATLNRETGFKACQKDSVDVVVEGYFTKLGDQFVVNASIVDARTRVNMGNVTAKGIGPESISDQVDKISGEIARKIGVPAAAIRRDSRPVSEITTSSMPAYKAYLEGRTYLDNWDWSSGLKSLRKAVQYDSTFALAYLKLGETYFHLSMGDSSRMAYEKAKRYSSKANEKDRLYIESAVGSDRPGIDILREIAEKYPKEKDALYSLAISHTFRCENTEAIAEYQKVIELDPAWSAVYNMLGYTYLMMGSYEEAIRTFQKYAELDSSKVLNSKEDIGETYFWWGRFDKALEFFGGRGQQGRRAYVSAFLENYGEAIGSADEWMRIGYLRGGAPEAPAYFFKGLYQGVCGRTGEALENLEHAYAEYDSKGFDEGRRGTALGLSYVYCLRGDYALSRQWLDKAHDAARREFSKGSKFSYFKVFAAYIDLQEGKIDSVQRKVDQAKVELSESQSEIKNQTSCHKPRPSSAYCGVLEAEVLLATGSIDEAVRVGESAPQLVYNGMFASYAFADFLSYNLPLERDVVARAYQKKGEPDKAISIYERLVATDSTRADRALIPPIYHYRLAKLYEERGRKRDAAAQYGKFVTILQKADIYQAEIADAKLRIARLSG